MSQRNKIPKRCLQSGWWSGGAAQVVTGAPLVAAQFKGGRYPVAAGGERQVGNTESSLRECLSTCYQHKTSIIQNRQNSLFLH